MLGLVTCLVNPDKLTFDIQAWLASQVEQALTANPGTLVLVATDKTFYIATALSSHFVPQLLASNTHDVSADLRACACLVLALVRQVGPTQAQGENSVRVAIQDSNQDSNQVQGEQSGEVTHQVTDQRVEQGAAQGVQVVKLEVGQGIRVVPIRVPVQVQVVRVCPPSNKSKEDQEDTSCVCKRKIDDNALHAKRRACK